MIPRWRKDSPSCVCFTPLRRRRYEPHRHAADLQPRLSQTLRLRIDFKDVVLGFMKALNDVHGQNAVNACFSSKASKQGEADARGSCSESRNSTCPSRLDSSDDHRSAMPTPASYLSRRGLHERGGGGQPASVLREAGDPSNIITRRIQKYRTNC